MLNIFDSKNNTTKIKRVGQSPAINQGKKFKKYQNKITNSLEKNAEFVSGKEGFTGLDSNGLTAQTDRVINKNNYSNQQQSIDNLRQEYQNTLQEYENLAEKISGNTTGYINRVNPNNPYLNKVVEFNKYSTNN
jgi:spore coat polysaccharide biosynthesis protein SpsF (cytidylyltransferase family)